MPYPSLADEISDLIHHRLRRAERHERQRIIEAALTIYSRTSSVVAFFRNQPVACYHVSSDCAFTLHGIPVELKACDLAPMPRIPYLDQVLEDNGEIPPQHGGSGRGHSQSFYNRYKRSTPSSSSSSCRHNSRPGHYAGFPNEPRRHYGGDRFTRDDARHEPERTYDSSHFPDNRRPGHYGGFPNRSESFHYNTSDSRRPGHYGGFPNRSEFYGYNSGTRGPAASSGYSTRGPTGGSSAYSSSGPYADEPHRSTTWSGQPGASSFYTREARAPGSSGASAYPRHESYSNAGGSPRRPESPRHNTETRGAGRSSSPPPRSDHYSSSFRGSGYNSSSNSGYDSGSSSSYNHGSGSGSGYNSGSNSGYNSSSGSGSGYNSSSDSSGSRPPPPRAQPQPREPPADGNLADRFEWLLKRPWGLYEILGVDQGATEAQIKAAYRRLALVHHPDKHAGAAAKAEANRRFQAINEAKECLSDAGKRREYDSEQVLSRF